jgi:hypothetical protein
MPCIDITENSNLLITQYEKSSKLRSVVDGFNSLMQTRQLNTLCNFEKGLSIDNAFGWLLNRLGDNFGFKRPAIPSPGELYFGYNDGGTNFDRAPYYYGTKEPLVPVGDTLYKKLLKIWIRGLFYDGSVYQVNQMLTDILGHGWLSDNEDQTASINLVNVDEYTAKAVIITNVIPKVAAVRYATLRLIYSDDPFKFGQTSFGTNGFVKTLIIKDLLQ